MLLLLTALFALSGLLVRALSRYPREVAGKLANLNSRDPLMTGTRLTWDRPDVYDAYNERRRELTLGRVCLGADLPV